MSKKIHILYTIPNFDTAGSGKVVYDLANHLDKKRFKVSIACNNNGGLFFKEVEALDLPIHIILLTKPIRPYYTLISRLKPFRKFLKKEKIDLVHSWNYTSDWTEPLACKLVGVPFIYTKKAMSWGNKHWKIRSYLSAFIITVNTQMQAFFPNKKQQALIPFGLDTSYYHLEKFNVTKNTSVFKIITVANLVAVKNIELLLEAMYTIKYLPIHLDIVGDMQNEYVNKLQHIVNELQLETQVSFLGKHLDVRPLLAQADVYVIPSKKEGMPMALVEAMAMQLPVLGANIPGISYVLQEFPDLLFPLSDATLLATKIESIYNLPIQQQQKLGLRLRNYCVKHFSMAAFIKQHEDLYLKIVKQ
ncbi:glycosyltransferase [Oceanihabitans sp. 2_MG-2023]|uniref:glycosyltransferase n=1 Tax=Oceanihabitans sp. 2_MG-2023 TaxID=3062661 RepID=UPI0026E12A50|nr:glycosyltransferase [Oceanihabitans sp. 2_MG-2023]MDO6597691.1 glycosyltransferase [Oceanihabitans sp. 2_MG-2023]